MVFLPSKLYDLFKIVIIGYITIANKTPTVAGVWNKQKHKNEQNYNYRLASSKVMAT